MVVSLFAICILVTWADGAPYLADDRPAVRPTTQPATAPAGDEPDGTPEAMYKAAKLEVTLLQKHQDLGEPIIPPFVAAKSAASKRLMEAERLVARSQSDRDAEIAAIAAHVERCREFRRVLVQRVRAGADPPDIQMAMADYDLAEAKLLLARTKAETPAKAPATSP